MNEVTVEIRGRDDTWQPVGSVAEVEPPGSISTIDAYGRRQVIVFGWLNAEGPGVWLSAAGVDVESEAFRAISTTNFEQLADLAAGPFETTWIKSGRGVRIRFVAP